MPRLVQAVPHISNYQPVGLATYMSRKLRRLDKSEICACLITFLHKSNCFTIRKSIVEARVQASGEIRISAGDMNEHFVVYIRPATNHFNEQVHASAFALEPDIGKSF
ncbi:hypothetical protein VNO77_40134 [Canavalia gladiata]|uniref:Uncharacterized protein n=1 Tax=Canavalia gladiata TaxID=3824 RepID=A0AAN9PRE0_CANGL